MNGKDIFASKTFWANIIMGGLTALGTVPVTKTTGLIALGLNIGLRLISGQPITSILGIGTGSGN